MDYRVPLFSKLEDEFKIDFLIFDPGKEKINKLEKPQSSLQSNVKYVNNPKLIRELHTNNYDVIINPEYQYKEAWLTAVFAEYKNIPLVQWTEIWDWPPDRFSASKILLYKKLISLYFRFPDSYIVPGNNQRQFLTGNGVDSSNIFIAPNSPNLKNIEKVPNVASNDDQLEVIFVGQLIPRKGVNDIIKAVDILNTEIYDIKMNICGTGKESYVKELRELAEKSDGINVNFLGWVEEHELAKLYNSADVFVAPSHRDPYPLTVMEAISTGTPVIISHSVGEAGDLIVDGYNGYIVPPMDPRSIADRLEHLCNNPNTLKNLCENALETYENNATFDHMVDGFKNAIFKAVDTSSK